MLLTALCLLTLTAEPAGEKPDLQADAALGRALVWAFAPGPEEVRLLAIDELVLLGDPRALDALFQLLRHPRGRIAGTALRGISRFAHPRAETLLAEAVAAPELAEPLRVAAIEYLVYQRTPSTKAFLTSVKNDYRLNYKFRETATRILVAF